MRCCCGSEKGDWHKSQGVMRYRAAGGLDWRTVEVMGPTAWCDCNQGSSCSLLYYESFWRGTVNMTVRGGQELRRSRWLCLYCGRPEGFVSFLQRSNDDDDDQYPGQLEWLTAADRM